MDRRIREPLTLSKHDKICAELNEMMIAIKLHHMNPPEKSEKPEQWAKAQSNCQSPTWESILDLLHRAYLDMDSCRYNPRKY